MTEAVLIFEGSKVLWKSSNRGNLSICVVSHMSYSCHELVVYNSISNVEAQRVFFDSILLNSKINQQEFKSKLSEEKERLLRKRKSFDENKLIEKILNQMIGIYVTSLVNIRCENTFQNDAFEIELNDPNSASEYGNYFQGKLDIECAKPPKLISYVVKHAKAVTMDEFTSKVSEFNVTKKEINQNLHKASDCSINALRSANLQRFHISQETKEKFDRTVSTLNALHTLKKRGLNSNANMGVLNNNYMSADGTEKNCESNGDIDTAPSFLTLKSKSLDFNEDNYNPKSDNSNKNTKNSKNTRAKDSVLKRSIDDIHIVENTNFNNNSNKIGSNTKLANELVCDRKQAPKPFTTSSHNYNNSSNNNSNTNSNESAAVIRINNNINISNANNSNNNKMPSIYSSPQKVHTINIDNTRNISRSVEKNLEKKSQAAAGLTRHQIVRRQRSIRDLINGENINQLPMLNMSLQSSSAGKTGKKLGGRKGSSESVNSRSAQCSDTDASGSEHTNSSDSDRDSDCSSSYSSDDNDDQEPFHADMDLNVKKRLTKDTAVSDEWHPTVRDHASHISGLKIVTKISSFRLASNSNPNSSVTTVGGVSTFDTAYSEYSPPANLKSSDVNHRRRTTSRDAFLESSSAENAASLASPHKQQHQSSDSCGSPNKRHSLNRGQQLAPLSSAGSSPSTTRPSSLRLSGHNANILLSAAATNSALSHSSGGSDGLVFGSSPSNSGSLLSGSFGQTTGTSGGSRPPSRLRLGGSSVSSSLHTSKSSSRDSYDTNSCVEDFHHGHGGSSNSGGNHKLPHTHHPTQQTQPSLSLSLPAAVLSKTTHLKSSNSAAGSGYNSPSAASSHSLAPLKSPQHGSISSTSLGNTPKGTPSSLARKVLGGNAVMPPHAFPNLPDVQVGGHSSPSSGHSLQSIRELHALHISDGGGRSSSHSALSGTSGSSNTTSGRLNLSAARASKDVLKHSENV